MGFSPSKSVHNSCRSGSPANIFFDTLKAQTVIWRRSSQGVVPVTVTCRAEGKSSLHIMNL